MRMHRNLLNIVIGIICIIVGIVLSLDFILKFALAALGIFLIIVGMSLITKRF